MEFHSSSSNCYLFPSADLFPYCFIRNQDCAQWTETSNSHIYSAEIPGMTKQEIILEIEDSRYIVIRTETTKRSTSFYRKLRIPRQVDINRISAKYVDGVFTVTVPKYIAKTRAVFVDPDETRHAVSTDLLASAA